MAQSPALKVHEVFPVAPPQGTTITTSLPLTFFDILWLRLPPVERLFFYELPTSTSTTSIFFDSVLPKLKHSLEITLQNFVPLAGSITWPHDSKVPVISYVPGDSVPLTVAESTQDFNFLCSNLCEVSKRHELVPRLKNISDEKASLLALQVTLFPNRGFCVGITTHHAGVDGKGSTLFMKAWAYTCSKLLKGDSLSSLPENLTPFFDRSVINDTKGVTEAFLKAWLNMGGENNRSLKVWETLHESQTDAVKGMFELTLLQIQKLKKHAQSKANKVSKVSTFSVTCAYMLTCLVKVEQPEFKKVAFIFSVDCRSRLDSPIDANYFGNCILPSLFLNEKSNDWFIETFDGINEALVELENNGVLNEALNWMPKVSSLYSGGNRVYSTAGSPRFEVYGIDFGFGRPQKVDVTSVDRTGAFALSESRNSDGGVEIGLALSKDHMEAFSALFHQELESFQCS